MCPTGFNGQYLTKCFVMKLVTLLVNITYLWVKLTNKYWRDNICVPYL